MIEQVEEIVDKLVAVKITDTLNRRDYKALIPEMESKIKQFGKINLYLEIGDGVRLPAYSQEADMHFNLRHAHDIKKVAFVGDDEHEEQILELLRPLENAEIRWYKPEDRHEALEWLKS